MIGCQINCVADADVALHLRHRSGVQQASSEDSGLRTLPPRKVYRMPTYFQTGATLVVVAVAVLAAFEIQPRVDLPDVTLGHPVNYFDNLLTPQQGDALRGLIHDMGRFPTNVQDVRFYKTTHEHIGEVCVGVQIPHLSWPSLTLALCSACTLLRSLYRRSPSARMASPHLRDRYQSTRYHRQTPWLDGPQRSVIAGWATLGECGLDFLRW